MKTNLFRVREKKDEKIVVEEERFKNPLILFFIRHKGFILMFLGLMLLCIMLISTGLAFSLFGSSSDFDISYIVGDEDIEPIVDPSISDSDIQESLTGVGTLGVVLLTRRFMTDNGDIISYFSDGTAIAIMSDGTIYRVYGTDDGEYGIDDEGNFVDGGIRVKVTSSTDTLDDGTVITYYSDGGALIEYNNIIIYTRDSGNIELIGSLFSEVSPSGVSLESNSKSTDLGSVVNFSDGTVLIINGDSKVIVNKNTSVSVGDSVSYDEFNSFGVVSEVVLGDGNTVTYFEDGSCVIFNSDGNYIYVNKSGDVVIDDDEIYEIVTNDIGYSVYSKICSDGSVVTYYDNGDAVIDSNGIKTYVSDSSNIIYDSDGNILQVLDDVSSVISSGVMTTGESVVNFDNGKSEVINDDGSSYIIDSSDIKLVDDDNNMDDTISSDDGTGSGDDESDGTGSGSGNGSSVDTSGIYVSDAVNTYNYSNSIETTTFVIRNKDSVLRKFRIVIEEVSDYSVYNASRLEPSFVRFQAVIGGNYISSTKLDSDIWVDSDGSVNYIIYDGEVKAKSSVSVNLSLYVDYSELDNSYQDKWFRGTIKVYLISDEDDEEEVSN